MVRSRDPEEEGKARGKEGATRVVHCAVAVGFDWRRRGKHIGRIDRTLRHGEGASMAP